MSTSNRDYSVFVQGYEYPAQATAAVARHFLETGTFPEEIPFELIKTIRNLFLSAITAFTEHPPKDPERSAQAYSLAAQLVRRFLTSDAPRDMILGRICRLAGVTHAILNKVDPKNNTLLTELEKMLSRLSEISEEESCNTLMEEHPPEIFFW